MDQLLNVSATGRAAKGHTKEKIAAEKLNTIKEMFSERLNNQMNENNKLEINARFNRLNKLLNAAITNSQTAIQKSKIDSLPKLSR